MGAVAIAIGVTVVREVGTEGCSATKVRVGGVDASVDDVAKGTSAGGVVIDVR